MSIGEDSTVEAEKINKLAGEKVKGKHFTEAIELYTKAINLNPTKAIYYSNRSFCHEKVENYGLAITDATKAISLDDGLIKAYFRRATSNMSIGHLKKALEDLEYLIKRCPRDSSIIAKHKLCSTTYNEQLLASAIRYVEKSPFDLLDIESITIDDSDFELAITGDTLTIDYAVKLKDYLMGKNILPTKVLYKILVMAHKVLLAKKTLVRYEIPKDGKLNVCGDVHGQFYDLCSIFDLNGLPSETNNYLFNGDFVDRGAYSVEVIILLLTFQIIFPSHFLLNRGNHETSSMNEVYGFREEVIKKYSKNAYDLFQELFQCLPIAHLINNEIFVVHGGLPSQDNVTLDDIEAITRFKQPSEGSIMFDLLWTDPMVAEGRSPSPRGVSTTFGPNITKQFCQRNNLRYIIRSHEAQMDGYCVAHEGKCITVFSAPNYCDELGNRGAIVQLHQDLEPKFIQFEAIPKPK